jgi:hypothetical protein
MYASLARSDAHGDPVLQAVRDGVLTFSAHLGPLRAAVGKSRVGLLHGAASHVAQTLKGTAAFSARGGGQSHPQSASISACCDHWVGK